MQFYICIVTLKTSIMEKVVLITGASFGIGKSTVNILREKGYIVYAEARRTDEMNIAF